MVSSGINFYFIQFDLSYWSFHRYNLSAELQREGQKSKQKKMWIIFLLAEILFKVKFVSENLLLMIQLIRRSYSRCDYFNRNSFQDDEILQMMKYYGQQHWREMIACLHFHNDYSLNCFVIWEEVFGRFDITQTSICTLPFTFTSWRIQCKLFNISNPQISYL